jgi:hypothetical protein
LVPTRVEAGLRPQAHAARDLLDLAALDFPQAKNPTEKDNWDMSIDLRDSENRLSGSALQMMNAPVNHHRSKLIIFNVVVICEMAILFCLQRK